MDDRRFDSWSKALAARGSRRQALAKGTGSALLGLLGLHSRGQAQSPTGLDANGTCRMQFEANVRLGPSFDAASNNAISGLLTISIGDNGGITNGQLITENGDTYSVTGQASGRSFAMRIDIGGDTLVVVGAGDKNVRACAGNYGGPASGPLPGDLGDWLATAEETPAGATATAASGGSGGPTSGEQGTPAPCTLTAADCSDLFFDADQCLCICQNTGEPICGPRCCTGGSVCVDNTTCVCPGGGTYCEGKCQECPPGAVCQDEQCICPPLSYYCDNNTCVPCQEGRTYDPNDCRCTSNCPGALGAVCNGQCVDLAVDPANCGICGNACAGNHLCQGGSCACPSGWEECNGAGANCVDTQNDPLNCGGCGTACGSNQSCAAGVCA
jgi:hypothetical protein